MEYAIDISKWQGEIDWRQVPQPIAIIKISGGDAELYFDSKANINYYGAKNAGKAIGLYHFAGAGDPIAEADFFIQGCQPLTQDDVLILDWEVSHPDPVGWCRTFTTHVHDVTGVWPMVYMNLATLRANDWSSVLDNSGLWIAAWGYSPEETVPTGSMYVMHQYTSDGEVPGIDGRVDLDVFFGTIEQFKKYGYQELRQIPQPEPDPGPIPAPSPEPVPAPTPAPQPQPEQTPAPSVEPPQTKSPEPTRPNTSDRRQTIVIWREICKDIIELFNSLRGKR